MRTHPRPVPRPVPRRRLLAAMLCLAGLSGLSGLALPAAAQTLPAADARAVRAVVEAQLQALAADDAVRAFGYASPAIRSQFGDAERFMAMVRSGYPMVVRPAATAFFQPTAADGAVLQVVQLRDRAGRVWRAAYQVQRQPDGSWRIDGCAVEPDSGKSST